MQIPSMLAGRYDEVRKRCAASIRRFLKGESWETVFPAEPAREVELAQTWPTAAVVAAEGWLVLNGPAPLLGGTPQFHLYLPQWLLLDAELNKGHVSPDRLNAAIEASLATPWGTLGMLAPKNQMLVVSSSTHRPLLKAALRFWSELDAVGPRYTLGLNDGRRLWALPNNLHYVLGHLGVDVARLTASVAHARNGLAAITSPPLPVSEFRALLPPTLLE